MYLILFKYDFWTEEATEQTWVFSHFVFYDNFVCLHVNLISKIFFTETETNTCARVIDPFTVTVMTALLQGKMTLFGET